MKERERGRDNTDNTVTIAVMSIKLFESRVGAHRGRERERERARERE